MNGIGPRLTTHATATATGAALRVTAAAAVRFYQLLVSPWLPTSCRFTPTCSEYARQSLLKHGVLRGSWLTLQRLSRCHPLGRGGYDPVS